MGIENFMAVGFALVVIIVIVAGIMTALFKGDDWETF